MTLIDPNATSAEPAIVRVRHADLLDFTAAVFVARGLPCGRARQAARALCYGDLSGIGSHGLANLTRLYLPMFDEGRVDPHAEPRVLADHGATALVAADRALGLWAAGAAMEMAADRAATYGIGAIAVRGATHLGCAGYHALRAVDRGMIGLVASNCGRQRIARPPGGAVAMLGTNPLSVAAPAGPHPPFVLDMSTTAAPTGRIRQAAREGRDVPVGLLCDGAGAPVTDPAAFDRGTAQLMWLGGEAGQFKGFGLGIVVEVLAALVSGAGLGAHPDAFSGDGGPSGRDDDIGYFVAAIAPDVLRDGADGAGGDDRADRADRADGAGRVDGAGGAGGSGGDGAGGFAGDGAGGSGRAGGSGGDFGGDSGTLFGALLDCPPVDPSRPVRYPGWHEYQRRREHLSRGVPLRRELYGELTEVAAHSGLTIPDPVEQR